MKTQHPQKYSHFLLVHEVKVTYIYKRIYKSQAYHTNMQHYILYICIHYALQHSIVFIIIIRYIPSNLIAFFFFNSCYFVFSNNVTFQQIQQTFTYTFRNVTTVKTIEYDKNLLQCSFCTHTIIGSNC